MQSLDFTCQHRPVPANARFSILIPTWNNLTYLQLCLRSLALHSHFPHQIILHINAGTDGTLEWAQEEGYAYTHSAENVGVCLALNAAARLAETDYILYLNDDMYVCPGWDVALVQHTQGLGGDFYASATMLEPYPSTAFRTVFADFGANLADFREADLLAGYAALAVPNWCGATSPPSLLPTHLWHLVGGYSVEFSPGYGSDPDLSRKLWAIGVRNFIGVGSSLVYHFSKQSTGRIRGNNGRQQFLRKWGITPRTFMQYYLRYGAPFTGSLPEVGQLPIKARLKSKWNRLSDAIRSR